MLVFLAFATCCRSSQPKTPTRGYALLLQIKIKVPFDKAVTGLLKAIFRPIWAVDLADC
jgi:hypothetical protein